MKLPLLSFFFLFALGVPLFSQEPAHPVAEPRSISVSGVAEKILPADRVEISVRVRTVRDDLSEAQQGSKTVFSKVVEQLAELGVPPEKIALRNHELGKEYETGPDRKRIHKGFFSARDFVIELDDAALLEMTQEELAQNPDVEVNDTRFSRKDEIEVRKELRRAALEAAQEKAGAMAEVYGQQIGKPLKIQEGGGFGPGMFNTRNTISMDAAQAVGGRVTLSAQVLVVFELVD